MRSLVFMGCLCKHCESKMNISTQMNFPDIASAAALPVELGGDFHKAKETVQVCTVMMSKGF